jgi:hypothetical protein
MLLLLLLLQLLQLVVVGAPDVLHGAATTCTE